MGSYVNLAYDYPVLGAFWTVMWIFLWVMWIFLLFRVIVDVFRDDSMNGWAKTGWLLFTIVLPFPDFGSGAFPFAAAALSSTSTSGFVNVAAWSSVRKRTWFPPPCRSFFGSASLAP